MSELKKVEIFTDGACSGNPGPMEYQCIDLATGAQVFHFGPLHGTNNIGEFLAIVHALALFNNAPQPVPIYSDSRTAISWVRNKKCNTNIPETAKNRSLFDVIRRAEAWLATHQYANPIIKWKTEEWGEIPADFGRKR